ncbi:thaumatin-domain containing protein [Ectocarpus siliculosus]|uniref:Thaumatin-domain containing protein n=1 Tax=Ectocarpus siliculosus TaxID=2880 RepID=D7FRB8_ECTSI|nr:thaumatin-domain containing protein [Ectocarpus siliculosus]|eukprot:CBJ30709.1 thaumatin-domain containing protein [Ectocarpus siliculosus]
MLSAEAAASAIDTPATALGDATIKKSLEEVEEDGPLSSKHGDISGGSKPLPLERKLRPDVRTEDDSDSPDLYFDSISSSIPTVLLEGCLIPADMTSVKVKHDKPKTGNIAEHAIDGDPSTWWGRRGINRWMDIEFEGGEDGDSDVSGVAIAFFRGHRRSAFFDMTLYDKYDNVVAKRKDIESGGQTQDYETFYFEEHAEGSKVRLDFKGTTAGIWNAVAEVSICLHNIVTPAPVSPPTVPPLTSSGLTYVGCFMDDDTGLTRFLDDKSMQDENLTPQSCAEFCSGYKYMALQYSQDCFCADTYYTAERDAIPTDTCNMPCKGDENVICGGAWSNSIYIVGDPTEMTEEELAAQEGPKESDGVPRRKFTVINSCFEQVRLGATGGYVKALDDPTVESCPEGSVLDEAVGACFWGLPLPEDDKTFDIEPGGSIEVILDNNAVNGVRWSGNMWAATGCHSKVGCETASCLRNIGYPDGYCPPSTGPTGPVTKAEFTLVDTGVDYYDVTAIDGVNVPVEMKPDPLSSPLEKLEDPYWCSNPGGVSSMSEELEGCTWEFDATEIDGFPDHDMSMYLRWVRNDGLFTDCEDDSDCEDVEGEGVGQKLKCGALFGQDTLNGGVTEEMFPKKCGSNLGWHSPNAICGNSRSKPLGYFPNSFPFMCDKHTMQVIGDNSTYSDIYGCAGPIYGLSGYSRNAEDTACGCPDWPALGINAPSESTCYGKNPYWEALSVPWLKYLKRACPTAYCFPYDDHSSTFVCRNEDENNDHDGKNSMSYTIEFCPGDSQGNLLEW